jgi:hypothetical protein
VLKEGLEFVDGQLEGPLRVRRRLAVGGPRAEKAAQSIRLRIGPFWIAKRFGVRPRLTGYEFGCPPASMFGSACCRDHDVMAASRVCSESLISRLPTCALRRSGTRFLRKKMPLSGCRLGMPNARTMCTALVYRPCVPAAVWKILENQGLGYFSRVFDGVAEREGFEPPIGLHLCRISSAVHSTTLPPLLKAPNQAEAVRGRGRVLGEDGGPDKRITDKIGGRHPKAAKRESWDRHTRAQIGGPMPPKAGPERLRFSAPSICGTGKLAMARMTTTRTRFKPYRSRLPPHEAVFAAGRPRPEPGRRGNGGGRAAMAFPRPREGARLPCRTSAKPFIFGRFLPRFALTPHRLPL